VAILLSAWVTKCDSLRGDADRAEVGVEAATTRGVAAPEGDALLIHGEPDDGCGVGDRTGRLRRVHELPDLGLFGGGDVRAAKQISVVVQAGMTKEMPEVELRRSAPITARWWF
jgi:hypothetical protein